MGPLAGDELLPREWIQQEVSPPRSETNLSLPASRAEKRKRSMVMTPHNPFPIFGVFLKQPELARTSCYEDLSRVFLWTSFPVFLGKKPRRVLPWWYSGWESACQCRGPSSIRSGNIPHAAEQLNHSYWAWSCNCCSQCTESQHSTTRGATATGSLAHPPQPETACTQHRRGPHPCPHHSQKQPAHSKAENKIQKIL